jgi:hypothetical protein
MSRKGIFVFGIFLLAATLVSIELFRLLSPALELSLGYVLIGIFSVALIVLIISPRSKLGQVRTPLVVQVTAGLLMGIAFAAEGKWGNRWPFLAWVAAIASITWFASLKLLFSEIRKPNTEQKSSSHRT